MNTKNLTLTSFLTIAILTLSNSTIAQQIHVNQEIKDIDIKSNEETSYTVLLNNKSEYKVRALQKGIDVILQVLDSGNVVLKEIDSPNGLDGPEEFDFPTRYKGKYFVKVKVLAGAQNSEAGKYDLKISQYTQAELDLIKKEKERKAAIVNKSKAIETDDIDNFWQAYDLLKTARSTKDSTEIFQKYYLDKASGGMTEAIDRLKLTAEKYVTSVASKPRFFNSIRANILEAKKLKPTIASISAKYQAMYANFKPYKVCFMIGLLSGTDVFTSSHFVIINCETVCVTNNVDLSELSARAAAFVTRENDITQQVIERIGHEATHFQQDYAKFKSNKCPLIDDVIIESTCDFVAELVTGKPVILRKDAYDYGNKNEKEVWQLFKADMCSSKPVEWLFNETKDGKPGNLGFAVGHKIIEAYYNKASDKKKALTEIINTIDTGELLEKSGYGNDLN